MVAIGRHRSPDVVTLDAVRCSGCRKSRDQPAGTHVKSRDAMRMTWGAAGDRTGSSCPVSRWAQLPGARDVCLVVLRDPPG
jgi:hypothetical protein